MDYLLCRNRVADFDTWKEIFDSQAMPQRAAGLTPLNFWRAIDEPNNVFFLFQVSNLERARKFVTSPDAAKVGRAAGVVDADLFFLEGP
jgi:hypothetical protein